MISPASAIDHTLLQAETSPGDIDRLCEEAVEHGFAAVCLPPPFVGRAAGRLYGTGVAVATVIGFPLGYQTAATKAFEAAEAVAAGASEIDMVIWRGAALAGDLDAVEGEIARVVAAADRATVKVILECCALTEALKIAVTERAVTAGAAFVKTSTGFGSGGATVEDVRLLVTAAAGRAAVKAAGGIRSWARCQELLAAGATRIGTSAGLQIIAEWRRAEGI